MTSGRNALHSIDAAIAEARRTLTTTSNAAAGDARALAHLNQRETDVLNDFAAIRIAHLDEIGDERSDHNLYTEASSGLDVADRQAVKLIKAQDDHVAKMDLARAKAAAEIERLEEARRRTEEALDIAMERHDQAAAETRQNLENDPEYQARARAVEEANATAERARRKLTLAENDRQEKGAAYEADPLFRYLHEREFATREYRAFPLFAILDGWVGRLIKYRQHRLNYERLLEIPERLAEHAARLDEGAAAAEEELEAIERAALERDGVDKRRDEVAALRREVDATDAELAAAETRHKETTDAHALAARGETGPVSDARDLVSNALSRMTPQDLKIIAAETATLEDDRLVDELIRVKRERLELEAEKTAAARRIDREARSLNDLEGLRRRFKTARFDSPYSEFSGRNLIDGLLAEFMRGALSRDDVWRRIERSHRTRRRDWDRDVGGDPWRDKFGLPDNWGGQWGGGQWNDRGNDIGRTIGREVSREIRRGMRRRSRGPTIRIPRAPRPRTPRFPRGGRGGRGGGFKTGGGF